MLIVDTGYNPNIPLYKYPTSCGVFAISIQSELFCVPVRVKYNSRFIFCLILVISKLLLISISHNITYLPTYLLNWFNY